MIPFVDLKAQYAGIKGEIREAIDNVLETGQFVLGSEVNAFEREFATFCQASSAVAVNTGTSALHLALLAANIGPGDEVITVPFTFVATVAAVLYTGAKPVFVDIDPHSYTMNVEGIEKAITSRTKAIMPVHLYGQTADMEPINQIARRHGLVVIEDAAQAHGADYKGRRAGSLGDIACFSFYPGKNLGAYGEGGALVTNNEKYAASARILRDWGQERKYHHVVRAFNYRMDGIQGAILRVKLRHLNAWTDARRLHAQAYTAALEGGPVGIPVEMPYARHVYHVYAVRTSNRDRLQRALETQGIQSGIHYPIPVHLQKGYGDTGYKPGDFPHSEKAADEVLSLPMFAELSTDQVRTISRVVREA